MRFLHISDLHIGKRLSQLSLIDDQRYVLDQIVAMAVDADCVLAAGDIFNRAQPTQDALQLAGRFFERLSATGKPIIVIAGNHDNAELIGYCAGVLRAGGIYSAGGYDGHLEKVTLTDEYGEVDIHLLPFIRPANVRPHHPECQIESYEDAVRCVLENAQIDRSRRNVLVAHQYVAGAAVCDSEELIVGGVDQISASLFEMFDYVALGHLHTPQQIGSGWIRYCGSPLAYSVSETRGGVGKRALMVDMDAKGDVRVEPLPLEPLHPVRELRGTLSELVSMPYSEDYVYVNLTDRALPMDAMGALRVTYPNIVTLKAECLGDGGQELIEAEDVEKVSPQEHFMRFFEMQNPEKELSEAHIRTIRELFEAASGEEAMA